MTRAYIGLGSNLADPESQIRSTLAELDSLPQTRCIAHSSLYRSPPLCGPDVPAEQPDFLNAVAELKTGLSALALLAALQQLENAHQRVRGERWGPRTLDLDLLLYGEKTIHTPQLTVPHPGLYERNFVLYPLAELMAGQMEHLRIPGRGTLADLLADCPRGSLERVEWSS